MMLIDPAELKAKNDLIEELTDALRWWNGEAEKRGYDEPTHELRHCFRNAQHLIAGQKSLPNLGAKPNET